MYPILVPRPSHHPLLHAKTGPWKTPVKNWHSFLDVVYCCCSCCCCCCCTAIIVYCCCWYLWLLLFTVIVVVYCYCCCYLLSCCSVTTQMFAIIVVLGLGKLLGLVNIPDPSRDQLKRVRPSHYTVTISTLNDYSCSIEWRYISSP